MRRVGPIARIAAPLLTLQKEFGWEMLPPKGLDAWNILSSHFVHDFKACQGQPFPYKFLLMQNSAFSFLLISTHLFLIKTPKGKLLSPFCRPECAQGSPEGFLKLDFTQPDSGGYRESTLLTCHAV